MPDRRAVDWLLTDHTADRHWMDGTPRGCSDCPFAGLALWLGAPDPVDADLGWYLCDLLKTTVWGEQPQCTDLQWKAKARAEVALPRQRRSRRLTASPAYPFAVVASS